MTVGRGAALLILKGDEGDFTLEGKASDGVRAVHDLLDERAPGRRASAQ